MGKLRMSQPASRRWETSRAGMREENLDLKRTGAGLFAGLITLVCADFGAVG